ncbi:MAG: hypothetical protein WCP97_08195 [bacterium]
MGLRNSGDEYLGTYARDSKSLEQQQRELDAPYAQEFGELIRHIVETNQEMVLWANGQVKAVVQYELGRNERTGAEEVTVYQLVEHPTHIPNNDFWRQPTGGKVYTEKKDFAAYALSAFRYQLLTGGADERSVILKCNS